MKLSELKVGDVIQQGSLMSGLTGENTYWALTDISELGVYEFEVYWFDQLICRMFGKEQTGNGKEGKVLWRQM